MMNSWEQFINTTCGAKLKYFLVKLNNEIWDVNNNPSKKNAVLLLNTRKGYWIYKVFEKNTKNAHKIELYSDRYVRKIVDISRLKDKFIYLVDDSLSQGASLLETFYLLIGLGIEPKMIFPLVFAMSLEVDIEKKVEIARQAGQEEEVWFWEKLNYFIHMSDDGIGELCMKQTKVLQKQGIPFVIDLPFLHDSKTDDEEMDFRIRLTQKQFERLKNGNESWRFHENFYKFNEEEIFPSFIFQMKDCELFQITSQFAVDFVMEGIYVKKEEDDIEIILIPFAILRSMDKEYLCKLWESLFWDCKNTEYTKNIQKITDKSALKNILRGKYRECVYFLSMYIAECFCNYMKIESGVELVYNYLIMKDHYSQDFINIVHELYKKMKDNPRIIYERLKMMEGLQNKELENVRRISSLYEKIEKPYNEDKAYTMINALLTEKKDRYLEWRKNPCGKKIDTVVSLEEIEALICNKFVFKSRDEEKYALTRTIVTMLNLSMCSNKLTMEEDGIKRGFRYGENSDLFLPFFNLYYYWAVMLYVTKIGIEKARLCYDDFSEAFGKWIFKDEFLRNEINQDILENNRKYFKKALKNKSSLYNKSSILESYYHNELGEIRMQYMHKIEEFVVNY